MSGRRRLDDILNVNLLIWSQVLSQSHVGLYAVSRLLFPRRFIYNFLHNSTWPVNEMTQRVGTPYVKPALREDTTPYAWRRSQQCIAMFACNGTSVP